MAKIDVTGRFSDSFEAQRFDYTLRLKGLPKSRSSLEIDRGVLVLRLHDLSQRELMKWRAAISAAATAAGVEIRMMVDASG